MLLFVAAPLLVINLAPQPACDALGSWMACRDGSTPACANVPSREPGARRNEKELEVRCPEGPRSATPLYLALFAISGPAFLIAFALVARSLTSPAPRGGAPPRT